MGYDDLYKEFLKCIKEHRTYSVHCNQQEELSAFFDASKTLLIPDEQYTPMLWIIDQTGLKTYHHIREIARFATIDAFLHNLSINNNNSLVSGNPDIDLIETNRVNQDRYNTTTHILPQEVGVMFFTIHKGQIKKVRDYNWNKGQFWIYTHRSILNLSSLQIYSKIDHKNYINSCFIHTILTSNLFNKSTIDTLKFLIKTRNFPKKKINEISRLLKTNLNVYYLSHKQKKLFKSKPDKDETYDQTIEMYLYLEHYFIKRNFTIGKVIIDSFDLIKCLFHLKIFKPIDPMNNEILKSLEYKKHMIEYDDLDYDQELCCRKFLTNKNKSKEYEHIIYSDFETDTSEEYHIPYLICSCYRNEGSIKYVKFEGEDCAEKYLNWLPNKSLIFFHNLKYDGSFFLNTKVNKEQCKIMERNGHIMQIHFIYTGKDLVFRDSYCIISKPLRDFHQMFKIKAEKEVSPYRIYNRTNRCKRNVNVNEIFKCLQLENPNDYINKQITFTNNCLQLHLITKDQHAIIMNAIQTNKCSTNAIQTIDECYTKTMQTPCKHIANDECTMNAMQSMNAIQIDIMSYAIHYCATDCKVLMLGLEQFDHDLQTIFNDNECNYNSITDFISISSLAYNLTAQYGCFEDCYELTGKPQNFIMRCMLGGRCMLAKNTKQHVVNKIQDFDAVSLYPSAMRTMIGIPYGIPKIIPDKPFDHNQYDYYFIEIEILEIDDCYSFPLLQHQDKSKKKVYSNTPGKY
ncbi:MAG: DNA polymerase, partial [Methanobrevibacter sp.]|nr:DNA polymerase [Candidatus Methanovirga australis]